MVSRNANRIIEITGANIPVQENTKLFAGFEALSKCNVRTYQDFRDLAGGPKGSSERLFSPSDVWRRATAEGFAKFKEKAFP